LDRQFRSTLNSLLLIGVVTLATAAVFRSWSLALVVTAGLLVHELGHILLASRNGVSWELVLHWAGIGTLTPLAQRRRLSAFQNGLIHLGGPLFSLLLALFVLGLGPSLSRSVPEAAWSQLANFSALLAVLNILPFGEFSDGGRVVQRLAGALPRRLKPPAILGLLVGLLSSAWALWATGFTPVGLLALLLIGLWLVVHMLVEAQRSPETDWLTAGNTAGAARMSWAQGFFLLAAMLAVLVLSTLAVLSTPFWLTSSELAVMTDGLAEVLHFLATQERLALVALGLLFVARWLLRRVRENWAG
jgi:hypothetical protein